MLVALWMLAGAAFADETPSLLLPGAQPAAAGEGEARVGAIVGGFLVGDGGGTIALAQLRAEHALTDRLLIGGSLGGAAFGYALFEGEQGYGAVGSVGARYLVVNGEHFRFAPWVAGIGGTIPGLDGGTRGAVAAGVAFEGGGRVRFDATVGAPLPLPEGVSMIPTAAPQAYVLAALYISEFGVSIPLGEHDELRFGKGAGTGGSARWRHLAGGWVVDAEVTAPQLLGLSTQLTVGRRW